MKPIRLILLACLLSLSAFADVTYTFKVGDPATLSVAVLPATATNLTYQWKKDGVNLVGATSASYRIPSLSGSDAGTYTVVISNAYGTVTSDNGFLVSGVGPTSGTISITKL